MEKLADPSLVLNFRPTIQQRQQIDQICQQTGVPRSIILRRALDAYLDRYGPSPENFGLVEKEQRAE